MRLDLLNPYWIEKSREENEEEGAGDVATDRVETGSDKQKSE